MEAQDKIYTVGTTLQDYNYDFGVSNKPELYANFAGIEYITKEKYNNY